MHTAKVIGAGLGLLALCVLAGKVVDGKQGMRNGTLAFVPLWIVGTGLNLYVGVKQGGYSVSEEMPVAAAVFAGPVAAALTARRVLLSSSN